MTNMSKCLATTHRAIGILGGMGPQATVDTMKKIIMSVPASCDQDHIPVVAVSIPDIPDRTISIQSNSNEPLTKMAEYLKILESANVGCVIIPCNTAHFWFYELKKRTHLKMISIIESVVEYVQKQKIEEICILATSATISTKLYQNIFNENNVIFSTPSDLLQKKVMNSIYEYKSGRIELSKDVMREVVEELKSAGKTKFLLACTEIPLILEDEAKKDHSTFIDATDILVKKAIAWYYSSSVTSSVGVSE